MTETRTRQIVYQSVACDGADTDLILEQSRHNNAMDGVTGVLCFNGSVFLQILEGSALAVADTFFRIARDDRHRDVQILSDRVIDERQFGYWSMESQSLTDLQGHAFNNLRRKIAYLPAAIQSRFLEAINDSCLSTPFPNDGTDK